MVVNCYVTLVNFEESYKCFSEKIRDDIFNHFWEDSKIIEDIEISEGDDNRDISIKNILTDKYIILLSIIDLDRFIYSVENENNIICDLSDGKNKVICDLVLERKENIKYTDMYILDNLEMDYTFLRISTLSKLSLSLFTDYPDKFNWDRISFLDLPEYFIEENIDRISWTNIDYGNLSVGLFVKYYGRLRIPKVMYDMLPLDIRRELEIIKILD